LGATAVVVAAPAHRAADLLRDLDAPLADALGEIEYASSATVTLAYRRRDLAAPLPGFGFVVPHREGRDLIACTFLSRKYPERAPADVEVVRAFVGGARRPEMATLPEDELIARVRADLAALASIEATPTLVRVHRWERAMPQYVVGHLARVAAIETRVARLPGLALAGAAYRGVGIPDCIHSGETAADTVLSVSGASSRTPA
jgi:oxygen-dependent protoporphyrinogen oxidase